MATIQVSRSHLRAGATQSLQTTRYCGRFGPPCEYRLHQSGRHPKTCFSTSKLAAAHLDFAIVVTSSSDVQQSGFELRTTSNLSNGPYLPISNRNKREEGEEETFHELLQIYLFEQLPV